jgi:hypothetical protein
MGGKVYQSWPQTVHFLQQNPLHYLLPELTKVETKAILRFARPVCYQNFPQEALPVELRNVNQRGIWRPVDNQLTKDHC